MCLYKMETPREEAQLLMGGIRRALSCLKPRQGEANLRRDRWQPGNAYGQHTENWSSYRRQI